jgi:hypothetical protein
MSLKTWQTVAISAAVLACTTTYSAADTLTETTQDAFPSDATVDLSVTGFNASLGTLTGVSVLFSATDALTASVTDDNPGSSAVTVSAMQTDTFTDLLGGSTKLQLNAPPFVTVLSQNQGASVSTTLVGSPAGFTVGGSGLASYEKNSIAFTDTTVTDVSAASQQGPSPTVVGLNATTAHITVTYTYTPNQAPVAAPEIDPASAASAMTLLLGSFAVMRGRKRRA